MPAARWSGRIQFCRCNNDILRCSKVPSTRSLTSKDKTKPQPAPPQKKKDKTKTNEEAKGGARYSDKKPKDLSPKDPILKT